MAGKFSFQFEISEADYDPLFVKDIKEQNDIKNPSENIRKAEVIIPSKELLEQILSSQHSATQHLELSDFSNNKTISLQHLSVKYAERLIQKEFSSSGTSEALNLNTDLITSVYEGGLKIWECSLDLVEFLHQNVATNQLPLDGKNVLELGCGAGLPGIYCLLNGATVHFQDYNDEVLKLFTMPNVALNLISEKSQISEKPSQTSEIYEKTPDIAEKLHDISEKPSENSKNAPMISIESPINSKLMNYETLLESMQNKCQFISGDWISTNFVVHRSSYDIILTSETIYNVDVQPTLYELIKYCLKPGEVALIAAKSYYFGVGGGTMQFQELVRNDGVFDISTVKTFSDGVKREILKITFL